MKTTSGIESSRSRRFGVTVLVVDPSADSQLTKQRRDKTLSRKVKETAEQGRRQQRAQDALVLVHVGCGDVASIAEVV